MEESYEYTKLLSVLHDDIKEDWNAQRSRGIRERAFSKTQFDKDLRKAYPRIITTSTFLKSVEQYLAQERPIQLERVQTLLRYLFVNLKNEYGWPSVVNRFKTYKNGAYYEVCREYINAVNTSTVVDFIKKRDLIAAGATEGEDLYIQMLQLVLKAKAEATASSATKEELQVIRSENEQLKIELRTELEVITALLEGKKPSAAIQARLENLKSLLD